MNAPKEIYLQLDPYEYGMHDTFTVRPTGSEQEVKYVRADIYESVLNLATEALADIETSHESS